VPLASIPSPGPASWRLGPFSVRAYALCIVAGIVVAIVVTIPRYRRTGGRPGVILDVAAWAIPFGLAGAFAHAILIDTRHDFTSVHRLWHAATAAVAAIGVPGAVALGAVGAWIACRRAGVRLGEVAGAAAPGVAFGLAIGGLGNWWAQQFYGKPSSWWWAVQISPEHRVPGYENYATFQPAFAYQSLWDVAVGVGVMVAARRLALSGGRTFMLFAAAYAVGGYWVESVRIGPLPHALGLRYGALGDIAVFVVAVVSLYLTRPRPKSRTRRPPPPRPYPRPAQITLVDESPGDVMST
jgi:prolipoprotein diacylglyceryltransferase